MKSLAEPDDFTGLKDNEKANHCIARGLARQFFWRVL
jgi:hypothetical protein